MKEIVIIGSGNLAESLAVAVAAAPELQLVQLFARNEARGREVAALAGTAWCGDAARLARAELYLIAVSDRAVAEVAAQLPLPADAAVAHTAGCVPLEALPERYARRAVFYPMQTFTRGRRVDFAEIPIFIEASTPALCDELEACARCLSRRGSPCGRSSPAPPPPQCPPAAGGGPARGASTSGCQGRWSWSRPAGRALRHRPPMCRPVPPCAATLPRSSATSPCSGSNRPYRRFTS
mgnify:CR=1 FL=1